MVDELISERFRVERKPDGDWHLEVPPFQPRSWLDVQSLSIHYGKVEESKLRQVSGQIHELKLSLDIEKMFGSTASRAQELATISAKQLHVSHNGTQVLLRCSYATTPATTLHCELALYAGGPTIVGIATNAWAFGAPTKPAFLLAHELIGVLLGGRRPPEESIWMPRTVGLAQWHIHSAATALLHILPPRGFRLPDIRSLPATNTDITQQPVLVQLTQETQQANSPKLPDINVLADADERYWNGDYAAAREKYLHVMANQNDSLIHSMAASRILSLAALPGASFQYTDSFIDQYIVDPTLATAAACARANKLLVSEEPQSASDILLASNSYLKDASGFPAESIQHAISGSTSPSFIPNENADLDPGAQQEFKEQETSSQDWERTVQVLEKQLEITTTPQDQARLHYKLALLFNTFRSDDGSALPHAEKAFSLFPNDEHGLLSAVLLQQQDPKRSIEHAQQALALSSDPERRRDLLTVLSEGLQRQHRFTEAIEVLQNEPSLSPNLQEALRELLTRIRPVSTSPNSPAQYPRTRTQEQTKLEYAQALALSDPNLAAPLLEELTLNEDRLVAAHAAEHRLLLPTPIPPEKRRELLPIALYDRQSASRPALLLEYVRLVAGAEPKHALELVTELQRDSGDATVRREALDIEHVLRLRLATEQQEPALSHLFRIVDSAVQNSISSDNVDRTLKYLQEIGTTTPSDRPTIVEFLANQQQVSSGSLRKNIDETIRVLEENENLPDATKPESTQSEIQTLITQLKSSPLNTSLFQRARALILKSNDASLWTQLAPYFFSPQDALGSAGRALAISELCSQQLDSPELAREYAWKATEYLAKGSHRDHTLRKIAADATASGNHDETIRAYLSIDNIVAQDRIQLALAYRRAEQLGKAIQALESVAPLERTQREEEILANLRREESSPATSQSSPLNERIRAAKTKYDNGNLEGAIATLEPHRHHANACKLYEQLLLQNGSYLRLAEHLRERLEQLPQGSERSQGWFRLGKVYRDMLHYEPDTYQSFRRAHEEDPSNMEITFSLRSVAMARGEWALAAALLKREIDATTETETKAALHLEMGLIHNEKLMNPEQAILHLETALELDDTIRAAPAPLAKLYSLMGNYSEASQMGERAALITPSAAIAFRLLHSAGLDAERSQDTARARKLYEAARLKTESPTELSQVDRALNRLTGARTEDSGLFELSSLNAQPVVEQKDMLRQLIQGAKSDDHKIRYASKLFEQDPGDPLAFQILADAHERRADHRALSEVLTQHAHTQEGEQKASLFYKLGRLYEYQLKELIPAVTAYELALTAVPGQPGALEQLADLAYKQKDWTRAHELYLQVAAETSQLSEYEIVFRRARSAEESGQFPEALANYQQATATRKTILGLSGVVRNGKRIGELRTAIEGCIQLLDLIPDYDQKSLEYLRTELASLYYQTGELRQAQSFYEQVVADAPYEINPLRHLTEIYVHQERYADAAKLLSRLVHLEDDPTAKAELYYRWGCIAETFLNDPVSAFDCFLKGSDIDPTHLSLLRALIRHYWNQGELRELFEVGRDLQRANALSELSLQERVVLLFSASSGEPDLFGEIMRSAAGEPLETLIAQTLLDSPIVHSPNAHTIFDRVNKLLNDGVIRREPLVQELARLGQENSQTARILAFLQ